MEDPLAVRWAVPARIDPIHWMLGVREAVDDGVGLVREAVAAAGSATE